MPYCAVYNCFSSSKVDKNVSFFRFPKDAGLQKAWIHYCRRSDLTLTKHSKICEKHFTSDQYSRYPPRLAELGYPNARAQLKYDAIPDVEWLTREKCSSNTRKNFSRYRKRLRLEVSKEALTKSDDTHNSDDNDGEERINVDADVSKTQPGTPSSLSYMSAECETLSVDKAIQQAECFVDLRRKPHVILGGDGRCDSPGDNAKYCSYALMDLETNKIIDIQLVQSNEVKGSTHMELEGLKRGLMHIIELNRVQIHDLVTDRNIITKSYMKTERPNINHYFDVRQLANGLSRKLETAAKRHGAGQIRPWIKSIVNHAYWAASSSGNNVQMKIDKWKSISNHLINVHEHDSEVFPRCEHGEIDEPREWMQQGSKCHKIVKDIVESPSLLQDLPKFSTVNQTNGLEVFHSVVTNFAPMSTYFLEMKARFYVAAFHYNENGTRRQSLLRDGELQSSVSYPKTRNRHESRRVPATFEYVEKLLEKIFQRRRLYPFLKFADEDLVFEHQADESCPLTQDYDDIN